MVFTFKKITLRLSFQERTMFVCQSVTAPIGYNYILLQTLIKVMLDRDAYGIQI